MMPVVSMMPAVVNVTEQTVSRVTTALTDGVGDITQDLLRFKANQFHTALVDPPWRFENRTGKVAPEHQRLRRYRTMTLDEIRALNVARVMATTAHLYLWCPERALARRPRGDKGVGASPTRPKSSGTRSARTAARTAAASATDLHRVRKRASAA